MQRIFFITGGGLEEAFLADDGVAYLLVAHFRFGGVGLRVGVGSIGPGGFDFPFGIGARIGFRHFGESEGGQALAFGLEGFDAYEFRGVDFERISRGVGQENQPGFGIVSDKPLGLGRGFESEPFQVREPLVGIEKYRRPDMVGTEFLDAEDVDMIVVVGGVESRQVVFAGFGDYQDFVLSHELAEIFTAAVVVEAQHVAVEPYLAPSQGGGALFLEGEAVNFVAGYDVPLALLSLDGQFGEISA